MANKLTKEAFLEGKPFYCPNDLELGINRHFKLRDKDRGHVDCKNITCGEDYKYESTVRTIADDYAIGYTSLIGKIVDTKIYYHEYNLVEEATDGTN